MYLILIVWYFSLEGPSVYGWPPVEYNQLLPAAATQTYGKAAYQRIHTQSEKKNLFFYNCNDIHLFMIISSVLVVVQAKKCNCFNCFHTVRIISFILSFLLLHILPYYVFHPLLKLL